MRWILDSVIRCLTSIMDKLSDIDKSHGLIEIRIPGFRRYMNIIMTNTTEGTIQSAAYTNAEAIIMGDPNNNKSVTDIVHAQCARHNLTDPNNLLPLATSFLYSYHNSLNRLGLSKDHGLKMLKPRVTKNTIFLRFERGNNNDH